MSNMNCRNIKREIEEAGSADLLSAAALSHLESCAACDTISRQQTKLQAIVAGLGTVEAPGDFEFRLRARLAGEKRGGARPLGNLSFGLRSAAVAAILLLLGSVVVFVALNTGSNDQVASGSPAAPKPVTSDSVPKQSEDPGSVTPGSSVVAQAPTGNGPAPVAASQHTPNGRRVERVKNELAGLRTGSRLATRDLSGTRAPVLTRDQLAESYPTAAFPINASYQSLKVSVDDARGTSRTISLPSVSFGSQRTLSQNASPLMASSRGSW